MSKSFKTLVDTANSCYENCNDYSCVRSGFCKGNAGEDLRNFNKTAEQKEKEKALYEHFVSLMQRYEKKKGSK